MRTLYSVLSLVLASGSLPAVVQSTTKLTPEDPAIGNSLVALATDLNATKDYVAREPVERRLLVWCEKFAPQNVPTGHADLALALRRQGRVGQCRDRICDRPAAVHRTLR